MPACLFTCHMVEEILHLSMCICSICTYMCLLVCTMGTQKVVSLKTWAKIFCRKQLLSWYPVITTYFLIWIRHKLQRFSDDVNLSLQQTVVEGTIRNSQHNFSGNAMHYTNAVTDICQKVTMLSWSCLGLGWKLTKCRSSQKKSLTDCKAADFREIFWMDSLGARKSHITLGTIHIMDCGSMKFSEQMVAGAGKMWVSCWEWCGCGVILMITRLQCLVCISFN